MTPLSDEARPIAVCFAVYIGLTALIFMGAGLAELLEQGHRLIFGISLFLAIIMSGLSAYLAGRAAA